MISDAAAPALSVVVLTPGRYERIRKTMNHLHAQTLRARLEVIIVCPSLADLDDCQDGWEDFCAVQCIEVGIIRSTGEPRAAGAMVARAPFVVFAEDHCFPAADWAAALVEAHRGKWGAVGATLTNANPASMLSWADLFLNFGPCVMRESGGPGRFIPWHNSSYPKSVLSEYGNALGPMLEVEGVMHLDQEKRGRKLFLCASAATSHLNITRFNSFLLGQFWGSRMFWSALIRREGWPVWKRMALAAGCPGLGMVRSVRALRELRRARKLGTLLPGVLAPLCAGAVAISLGALAGALWGAGDGMSHRISLELYRDRHLREEERSLLTD